MDLSAEEVLISRTLMNMGASPQLLGFYYLVFAIDKIIDNPLLSQCITTKVYPQIAERYSTSLQSVERCIRTVINNIWNLDNNATVSELFNENITYRPSNAHFITVLAMQLKLKIAEEKNKNSNNRTTG